MDLMSFGNCYGHFCHPLKVCTQLSFRKPHKQSSRMLFESAGKFLLDLVNLEATVFSTSFLWGVSYLADWGWEVAIQHILVFVVLECNHRNRFVLTYVQSCVSLRVKSFSLEQPFRLPHEPLWCLYKILDFLKSVLILSFSFWRMLLWILFLYLGYLQGLNHRAPLFY